MTSICRHCEHLCLSGSHQLILCDRAYEMQCQDYRYGYKAQDLVSAVKNLKGLYSWSCLVFVATGSTICTCCVGICHFTAYQIQKGMRAQSQLDPAESTNQAVSVPAWVPWRCTGIKAERRFTSHAASACKLADEQAHTSQCLRR